MLFLTYVVLVIYWGAVMAREPSVSAVISPEQYCEGCQLTVEAYSLLIAQEIKRLLAFTHKDDVVVDIVEVLDNTCGDEMITVHKDFVRYSCMKMVDEVGDKLLQEFTGDSTLWSLKDPGTIMNRGQKVRYEKFPMSCANMQ